MRTLIVVVAVALAGCGGKTTKTAGNKKKGPPTCTDAAAVLATKAGTESKDSKRQAAIGKACVADKWPAEVVKCVVNWPQVEDCLMQLTDAQRTSYLAAKVAAAEPNLGDTTVTTDVDDPDPYATSGYTAPPVQCDYALGDLAAYDPPITHSGEDRDFAIGLRRITVHELCEQGWPDEVRRCFADGYDVLTCRNKLDATQEQLLADQLVDNDNLLTRIGKLVLKPAAIDCKKVVAVHYADDAWKGKVDTVKGKTRKKMIADSRAAMKRACTDDGWSALMRACIVGDDGERCLRAVGIEPAVYGFPAAGVSAGGATATASAGLYDRLGNEEGIAMLVDTWLMTMQSDDRVASFFGSVDVGVLEGHLINQMCQLTGGTCTYTGRDMKAAHKGLGIKQEHVDAFLDDLQQSMLSMGLDSKDIDEVVKLYRAMGKDVITP